MSKFHKVRPRVALSLGVSVFGLVAGLSSVSHAQTTDGGANAGGAIEDIVIVTGSLIRNRRQDFRSPSPVQTLDSETFDQTGAIQIQDVFKGITSNAGSELFGEVTARQGTSQFSLRGLGVGSTLTLINGRRAGLAPVANSSGALFTDVNQYPTNMIERVEVLTDGASATYGSEAVAGVVNIYTRNKFEGVELTGEFRDTSNQSGQMGAAIGVQGDRGGIAVFANYYTQSSNTRSDFPRIAEGNLLEDGPSGAWDSATGSPGRFNLAVADPNASGGFVRAGNTLADPDCVAAGGMLDGTNCRYHFLDQRRIIAEEDRIQMFTTANYDVTDNLNLFAEASFSRNEVRDGNGGLLIRGFPNDGGFLVPGDHPFNFFVSNGAGGISYVGPDGFSADPTLQAVPVIYRGRVLGADADGPNQAEIKTIFNNTRFVGGFDFNLNGNWNLYGSYTYANSDFSRNAPNEWDVGAFTTQILNGSWNPFGTRISNPGLISPRDGVSTALNEEEVLSEFNLNRLDVAFTTQTVGELILSGDTGVNLPGGTISAAFGTQYRKISLGDTPDGRYQNGNNRLGDVIKPISGKQDVIAVFGEIAAPVTDKLELQAALRFEDYGDQGGDTLDPKVSAKYQLTDALALRGSWGTSFQAPSLRQIVDTVGTTSITDPRPPGGNSIITTITRGDPNLSPQSAENLNLGVVFRHESGFNFTGDFFTYDYKNLILPGASPQAIFNLVEAGQLDPQFALRGQDGQVATAISQIVNGGSAKVNGLDLVANYSTELFGGDLLLDAKSTIITKYDSIATDGTVTDIKGNRNFNNGFGAVPDFRLNVGATFAKGEHSFGAYARHIGSYTDDESNNEVASNTTFDVRYDVEVNDMFNLPGDSTRLSIGSVNLFDTLPPRLESRPNMDFEVHDIRGRQVYVALKQTF